MNQARFRAWRFLMPGLDAPANGGGLLISATGGIAMVQEDDAVRQALLLLLSTVPGERVMRPDYGCLLHRLIFSPNDDTTAGLAIHYVRSAIERWEPRVDIVRIDATRDPGQSADWLDSRRGGVGARGGGDLLYVTLTYRVRATRQVRALTLPVNLAGPES
jgi:phage baseplate assembly protein W